MIHRVLDGALLSLDGACAYDVHTLDPCNALDGALFDVEEFTDPLNIIHKCFVHLPMCPLDLPIGDGEDELVLAFEVDGDEDHHGQDDCYENQNSAHRSIVQTVIVGVKSSVGLLACCASPRLGHFEPQIHTDEHRYFERFSMNLTFDGAKHSSSNLLDMFMDQIRNR